METITYYNCLEMFGFEEAHESKTGYKPNRIRQEIKKTRKGLRGLNKKWKTAGEHQRKGLKDI